MNSNLYRISIVSFFLLFGKALFDINIFAEFFQTFHSPVNISIVFGNTCLIGLVLVLIFNYLQRAFNFRVAITYTYFLLLLNYSFLLYYRVYSGYSQYLAYIASSSIPLNLLIILSIRGLLIRIGGSKIKKMEKYSNIAFSIGILLSGTLLLTSLDFLHKTFLKVQYVDILSFILFLFSVIFMIVLFNKEKKVNTTLDNIQEIRVKQNIFKLIVSRYFSAILTISALAGFIIFFVYSHFIRISIIKYSSIEQLINIFSISVLIFSGLSIIYEVLFKEKAFYAFGVKVQLILLPIVVVVFSIIILTNAFYFKILPDDEFFFFIPIVATLYLIFSQFSFVNFFYPVINSLYLPLDTQNQNDFYIKSSFLGFLLGIGGSSLAAQYIIPKISLINDTNYVVINIVVAIVLIIVNRLVVYNNYKAALHKRLEFEEKTEVTQKSFVDKVMQRIKDFSGIRIIRVINLLYIINPVKSKKFLSKLTTSEDPLTQRAGLITSIRLYLLEIYNKMLEISKTKYFPSSPNRDKTEQLLSRFEEVKTKMKKTYYIRQLSISKKDIERVYGGMLALYAPEEQQAEMLARLVKDPKLPVAKNAIISAADIDDPETIKSIIEKFDIAELSNAAYSALMNTEEDSIHILEDTFYETGQSERVQIKIVRLLGDIASEKAVEYLLKKLNYTNQNIISAALEALSKCNTSLPEKKAMIIKHELDEVCRYLVWNTSLLIDLDKQYASEILIEALKIEIKYNYKSLFNLLSLLYNPGSIELIRKNLWSNDYEKISFALELASVVIKDEMKPMIIPLLRPLSNEERLKRMQTVFATEKMQISDILYDIIQRDYKWINPWTKACAIMEVAKLNKEEDISILLANMVNPDPMLAELAALNVFSIDKEIYFKNKDIFDTKFTNIVSKRAINAIESGDGENESGMPVLKFEIIKYLQQIEEFSKIPGEILKYLTDDVTPLEFSSGDEIENIDNIDIYNYYYIIYSGKVNLFINNVFVKRFEKDTLLTTLDLLIDYEAEIKLVADSDVKVYKIDPSEFADNLSFYDEIPFSIVENTPVEKISIYEKVLKNEKEYRKKRVLQF